MILILFDATIRSLAFAGAVGLLLWLARVRDVGTRLAAWTAVLYGVSLLPLAGLFVPTLAVPVVKRMAQPAVTILQPVAPAQRTAVSSKSGVAPHIVDWPAIGSGLYLAVAGLLLARFGFGLMITRRLRRTALLVDDRRMLAALRQQTRIAGVRKVPALAESDLLTVPITTGWLRPSIILPVSWREWDDAKTGAVLAHELSHVRRADYATLWLASLYRCLFWFNPLGWWLDRHLRELAEQASDDSALRATADRTQYAEVLLGFFEALHTSRKRVRWQVVSMARAGRADRRIDRILALDRRLSGPARWPVVLGLALLTVPLLYVAAALQPVVKAQEPPRTAGDKSLDSYVVVHGDNVSMSGSIEDLRRAQGFRYKLADDFIWFRRGGKAYVIRDAATVKAARKLFEPQEELGERQSELGEQQAKLGELQAKLGEKQSTVRTTLPDLTRQVEMLKELMKGAGTSEELGDVQALLAELQAKVGDQQAKIGDQQAKIGEEQAKLGEQQAKLGEKQAALGEEQAKRSEAAMRGLKTLIDDAFKKGLAEPEPR